MSHLVKDQKGQTLAVIVMVMAIALGIGITMSTRFAKTLRGTVRTDASSRAIGVAEALVERLLTKDFSTLSDYINFGNCGTDCALEIIGADGVSATAVAELSYAGGDGEPYPISLNVDEVIEVSLDGYPDDTDVYVCWDDPSEGEHPSIAGQIIHGTLGDYASDAFAFNSIGSIYGTNGFTEATASFGYNHCATLTGVPDIKLLRVRSLYNSTEAYVVPEASESIPSQGILITSTGTFMDTQRKARVIVSNSYLPLPFDFILHSRSETDPLSN